MRDADEDADAARRGDWDGSDAEELCQYRHRVVREWLSRTPEMTAGQRRRQRASYAAGEVRLGSLDEPGDAVDGEAARVPYRNSDCG